MPAPRPAGARVAAVTIVGAHRWPDDAPRRRRRVWSRRVHLAGPRAGWTDCGRAGPPVTDDRAAVTCANCLRRLQAHDRRLQAQAMRAAEIATAPERPAELRRVPWRPSAAELVWR